MRRRDFFAAPALAPLAAAAQGAPGAQKAGFAERDITPEIGMEQPGGYGKVFHTVVHDPCKVRAAVFDDGSRRVALVSVDALVVPRPMVVAARRGIREKCGIEESAVLIGASHSHSSGPTGMVLPGEYDHASPLVRELAYEKSSMANAKYLSRVEDQIVSAVSAADSGRGPLSVGFGAGTESRAAFNRRFRMKNGLTYTHPGQGNPDMLEPAGPIDPDVAVIGVWDTSGKLAGCVVNYACHATTSPRGISANWIYYLERVIRGAYGPDVVVVFLQGFSGDVTQVDNRNPYAQPSGEKWAELVGGRVGAEAVKVLTVMTPGAFAPVNYRNVETRFARRVPSPERLRRSLETVRQDPKQAGATEWTFAKEIVLLDAILAREKEALAEVQAVQVGPAVFLAAPGEMFCQLGLDIKKGSRFPITCPVELANGCVGYIPTEEALGPHGGGYETRLTSYSNLEPHAGTRMVETAIRLAAQLTPGTIPRPPKRKPFQAPWGYGNVPPELE